MHHPSIVISRTFSWLLPVEGFVAAVIIYASIYVFGIGTVPFILAVVATALHFLLGLYVLIFGNKPAPHHLFIPPVWLIACVGVWTGALYYFAQELSAVLGSPLGSFYHGGAPGQPALATWTNVGCATTSLNILIDFVMLAFFVLDVKKQTCKPKQPDSIPTDEGTSPSMASRASRASQVPVQPFPLLPQGQFPQFPQFQLVHILPHPQYHQLPFELQHQDLQYQQQPAGIGIATTTDSSQPITVSASAPSSHRNSFSAPPLVAVAATSGYRHSFTGPPLVAVAPIGTLGGHRNSFSTPNVAAVPSVAPSRSSHHRNSVSSNRSGYVNYDQRNRIEVIRRLSALQHPDGHWDFSPELSELVRLWGRRLSIGGSGGQNIATVTALAHDCLSDLCDYVWAAQRDGREREALGPAEIATLRSIGWDLSWAAQAVEKGEAWLEGR